MSRGQALDLRNHIQNRVAAQPDAVWTAVDFLDLGPRAAIDKALQRLAQSGAISRIGWGLYFRRSDPTPIRKRLTGLLNDPDHGEAIRRDLRDGAHALPTWMEDFLRPLIQDRRTRTTTVGTRTRRATR